MECQYSSAGILARDELIGCEFYIRFHARTGGNVTIWAAAEEWWSIGRAARESARAR